jgi:Leucine-rich repeat (LRR) protein
MKLKLFLFLTLIPLISFSQVYFETYQHPKTNFAKEIDPLSSLSRVKTYDDIDKAVNVQKSGRKVVSLEIIEKPSKSQKDALNELTYLMELKISTEALKDCPELVGKIRSLKSVIIDNTSGKGVDYKSFAEVLANNRMLESLEVINCQESEFPQEIYQLKQLKQIKFINGNIATFPVGLSSFSRLEYLIVDNNKITEMPSDIGSLNYLRVLRMKGNKLSTVSNSVSGLRYLEYFDLSENNFSEIPSQFKTMTNLKHLNFSRNILTQPPADDATTVNHIDNLMLKGLKTLNLSDCNLEYLPKSIKRLSSIIELDLSGNRLENLPNEICECGTLQELYLNKNLLYHLPDSLGSLFYLRILDLDEIENIVDLPRTFVRLNNLEVFFLNRAKNLNHEALYEKLREIKNMKVIALVGMELEKVPYDLFREGTLKAISLDYNNITNLPLEICNSEKIEEIRVMNNKLSSLPNCFETLKNLKYLNISYNRLIDIPGGIYKIESMLYMPTSGNAGVLKPIDRRQRW